MESELTQFMRAITILILVLLHWVQSSQIDELEEAVHQLQEAGEENED